MPDDDIPPSLNGESDDLKDEYLTYKDLPAAIDKWLKAIQQNPDLLDVRTKLAQAYERLGDIPGAVEQYLMIAVIFLRHGDAERGQRALPRAERLISQLGRTIPAGESAGDIDAVNETDASDDADRLRAQCESHFRDGRSEDAIGILDRLMTHYAQTKQTPKILRTLETLAEQFPREPGLRSRLARTYEQLGRVPDAIAQWDALAVVLIEIGQYEEAIQVIRLIIHLPSSDNPRN